MATTMATATDQDVVPERGSAMDSNSSIFGWYDSTHPLFIDLVGDYAGKELFLVEGDSLLRDCFADDRIDFEDGFQLLHAVYVVERFLENLVKRHCNFHIAFIEENVDLCIPSRVPTKYKSRYRLAREVIKEHLTTRLRFSHPNTLVHTFKSLESKEFKEYLHKSAISFVMAHDGAIHSNESVSELEQKDEPAKTLLRGMIFWFNTHKLNVALLNRIEFRDSKVFTMIVESFRLPATLASSMTLKFMAKMQEARKALSDPSANGSALPNDYAGSSPDENSEANSSQPLNQSLYLTAHTLSNVLKEESDDWSLASAFALHSTLLLRVPLSQRRLPLVTFDDEFEHGIVNFLDNFAVHARHILRSAHWKLMIDDGRAAQTNIIDLVDGRLFRVVVQGLCEKSLPGKLPRDVLDRFEKICAIVENETGESLSLKSSIEAKSSQTTGTAADFKIKPEELSVLPFSSAIFDAHLDCIHVTANAPDSQHRGAMRVYRETTHWHNHRKPLNPKVAPVQEVSKWRNPLRTNQFYMREMTSYAASLTGTTGKALVPETITVGPKQLVKIVEQAPTKAPHVDKGSSKSKDTKEKAAPVASAKKGTKKAALGLSKTDQMKADNKMRTEGKESDKVLSAWTTVMKGFESMSDDQDRYLQASNYLTDLDSTKRGYLEGEVNMYILQSLLAWWASYCKDDKKGDGYHVVALIWTTVRTICSSKSRITSAIATHVKKVCALVGISDALTAFEPSISESKLSFPFEYPPQTQTLRIGIPQTELQLNHCGPYMDRMLDAKPDPRVSSFVPDGWQREVLDQLDAQNSVFVVAPTSAGKTFISFYAMEQILRADNDGVLVYVAPTKALVNQIAAEVQGRFSKRFPLGGKGVWAIHTRDYRVNNSTGCQILVTVPHILQIMLLSPSNSKSWAPRLKRIIFDEIHSIGQAEDGVVWEQLLLLSPCPIIALSATVGNPDQFNEWLSSTQKVLGSEMKMIKHSTRYSDLRKYIFDAPLRFRFTGLGNSFGVGLGLDGLPGFRPFHPVASLVDRSRGMPDDLALEPKDCLSLWNAMSKYQNSKYKVPESLDPAKALPPCIRKADIFKWERSLKELLLNWMADYDSPFDLVVAALSSGKVTEVQVDDTSSSGLSSRSDDGSTIQSDDLTTTTLPLLHQLHKRRALPALFFNYDRNMCEKIAEAVLSQLVRAEDKWKEGPEWRKKMEGYQKYVELKEKSARKPVKPIKKAAKEDNDEGGSKTDRMREESSEGSSSYDLFDPEAPQPNFSFANPKVLQKVELEEFIRQLRRKNIREPLIDLLKRGIGVHHAGMNRKYRQCVEMLFRKGFLRVVIATGTLSLGINMPCATVVFSGDSVYLTALNFRQAAGRAGRRGFDLLGNVVFQGISKERASRLLSSRLPELTGHFPITTTLILRLFTLLHGSKSSPYAKKAIDSLLSQPRLYLGGDSFKEQVLHHLRFSIEYLRRNDLLGPGGEPVNLTSCVSHLYFTENSSFAFHALLKGGYFHQLCRDINTKTSSVLLEMMLVLSHLFGRRPTREVDDPEEAELIKRSASMVYLPPMPNKAAKIMRQHNNETLDIFTTYVKTFAAQHIKEEEVSLPLTGTSIGPHFEESAEGKKISGHASHSRATNDSSSTDTGRETDSSPDLSFLPSLPSPHARSAFVALSGFGDDFTSIEDLCSSTRAGVFLESSAIPHLELHPDETKMPLNAYLLDFYKHGAIQPLNKANGIRKADVWFVLNDFSMILATIVTSLANYLGFGNGDELEMLDVMGSGDMAENVGDEEMAAAVIPDPTPAASITNKTAQLPLLTKKSKVVDDWNAGEDALDAEEQYLKTAQMNGQSVTDDEEYNQLMNVYKGFRMLKKEFDEKFREIWA